jgi:hypothetical protein
LLDTVDATPVDTMVTREVVDFIANFLSGEAFSEGGSLELFGALLDRFEIFLLGEKAGSVCH